jgi:group II intron reverse transcriptase/maturase
MSTSRPKPNEISKEVVWQAFRKVKANHGAAGVDGESIEEFEKDLKGNLYKLWNRMSSGSYLPPPVRMVEIPKPGGRGVRVLGVPTVADRVAQTVVALYMEPDVEPLFHADSYGYRPGRSALQAVGVCRQRCWQRDWVIDLDIKAFFDNLDHELVLRAVSHHTDRRWIHLYVQRWLVAPLQREDGTLVARDRGSPQGSAVSPLLANLFMHYAFDAWMARTFPTIWFERYVDDAVVHCKSEGQARHVLQRITERLAHCKLEVHPAKTKIVYCKDGQRLGSCENERFDFLGYTFRPRSVRKQGHGAVPFVGFCPAVSDDARKTISRTIRRWRLHLRSGSTLEAIARAINPIVRGWSNYYGRYYPSMLSSVLDHINAYLVRWAQRKFKRLRRHTWRAWRLITRIARRDPQLFVHWALGVRPTAG